jgi:hypothetical protein
VFFVNLFGAVCKSFAEFWPQNVAAPLCARADGKSRAAKIVSHLNRLPAPMIKAPLTISPDAHG